MTITAGKDYSSSVDGNYTNYVMGELQQNIEKNKNEIISGDHPYLWKELRYENFKRPYK